MQNYVVLNFLTRKKNVNFPMYEMDYVKSLNSEKQNKNLFWHAFNTIQNSHRVSAGSHVVQVKTIFCSNQWQLGPINKYSLRLNDSKHVCWIFTNFFVTQLPCVIFKTTCIYKNVCPFRWNHTHSGYSAHYVVRSRWHTSFQYLNKTYTGIQQRRNCNSNISIDLIHSQFSNYCYFSSI